MTQQAQEVADGRRFEFGQNWRRFLEDLTEERIGRAQESLQAMLGLKSLAGQRFLDIGSVSFCFLSSGICCFIWSLISMELFQLSGGLNISAGFH